MAKLRPARTMRFMHSQSWSRYSIKKPKKNYIRALPHTSLLVFRMGVDKPEYDMKLTLNADQYVQLRSNALESARLTCNKFLENEIPGQYFFRIVTFPHQVIREKKRATGAGADRLSQGMSMSFGKAISVAARINRGAPVLEVRTNSASKAIAKIALKRGASKLSGTYTIGVYEIPKSKAVAPKVPEVAAEPATA